MFWSENGAVVGGNTDVEGLLGALRAAGGPAGRPGSSSAPAGAREPPWSPRASSAWPSRSRPARRSGRRRFESWIRRAGSALAPAADVPRPDQRDPARPQARMIHCRWSRSRAPRGSRVRHGVRARARRRGSAPCAPSGAACGGRARHAGGPGAGGVRALVSASSRSRRGDAGGGQCRASLTLRARLAGARALAAAGRLPPLRRADRRREGDALICDLCRLPLAAGSRGRSATAAASRAFGGLDCRLCAEWPAGLAGYAARCGWSGSARDAVHQLKYEGWSRRRGSHGRGDARARAIDAAGYP